MKRRKSVSLLTAVVLFALAFCCSLPWASAGEFAKGDLNRDGKVTSADARIALRIAAKLETADSARKKSGDVNGDGKITSADARKILRVAARLEDFSPQSPSVPLPYGIRFGMTYDEVVAVLKNNGVRIPPQENNPYNLYLDEIVGIDPSYLHSDALNEMFRNGYLSYDYPDWTQYGGDYRDPKHLFEFNENGRLYSIAFIKDCGSEMDERIENEIAAYYKGLFGNDGDNRPDREYSHGVLNIWGEDPCVRFRLYKTKIEVDFESPAYAPAADDYS